MLLSKISTVKNDFFRTYILGVFLKSYMCRVRGKGNKVFGGIITLDFIYMVNVFFRGQISSNMFCNNKSVFSYIIATLHFVRMIVIENKNISFGCLGFAIDKIVMFFASPINAMRSAGTFWATKSCATVNFTLNSKKTFFTYLTTSFNLIPLPRVFTFETTKFYFPIFYSVGTNMKYFTTDKAFFNHKLI